MKKFTKIIIVLVILATISAGFYFWHISEMDSLKLSEQAVKDALMAERIQLINDKNSANGENQTLRDKIANLENKIEELLVEEEIIFDAAPIEEEILKIGELATEAYSHTTVGSLDAVEYFKHLGWKVPGSQKTVLVEMDGMIKVGIDVTKINITTDETTKTITINIPEAMIISNELFEDTMVVHIEEEGIFNDITLADSSRLRTQIKEKAEQKVLSSDLFEQAQEEAGQYVCGLIDAVPGIADAYTIVVK